MYGLSVRFELRDGDAAAGFDRLVGETLPLITEGEPGTLVYAVHAVDGEPLSRVFYELYVDEAAFQQHEREEHVRRFLVEREKYVARLSVDRLRLMDGKGVIPIE